TRLWLALSWCTSAQDRGEAVALVEGQARCRSDDPVDGGVQRCALGGAAGDRGDKGLEGGRANEIAAADALSRELAGGDLPAQGGVAAVSALLRGLVKWDACRTVEDVRLGHEELPKV